MINAQKNMKSKSNRYPGFTLIELMITVAVIGILAAVAFPSFVDQIRKARRAEAMSASLECATIQERRYTMRSDYEDDACDTLSASLEHYQIAVTHPNNCQAANGNDTCFLVTITPLAASSQAEDSACTRFTLTDLGVKGATGGDSDNCWRD